MIMRWTQLFGRRVPHPGNYDAIKVPHPSGYDPEIARDYSEALSGLSAVLDAAGVPGDTDTIMVTAFVSVMEDNTDGAREAIRDLSPGDSALLAFYARELSRVLGEEDMFRESQDRRRARLSYRDRTAVDELLGQGVPDPGDPLAQP